MSVDIELDRPTGESRGGGATNLCCGTTENGCEWSVYIGSYAFRHEGVEARVNSARFSVRGRFEIRCWGEKAEPLWRWVTENKESFKPCRNPRAFVELLRIVLDWLDADQAALLIESAYASGVEEGRRVMQADLRQMLGIWR